MLILQAIVYGVVQGVTEFLPISSTAHLILIPWILKWTDPGIVFDVSIHLGTALAVFIFFYKDWIALIVSGFTKPKSDSGRLFWLLVIATIPGALAGFLLDPYLDTLRHPLVIAIALIVMGGFLYLADKYFKNKIELKKITLMQSIIIGLSQIISVIPGVSRSGITMTTGRSLGIERKSIAKFVFLMSAPLILGDGIYQIIKDKPFAGDLSFFLVGIITSTIVGILSIRFLLTYLSKHSFLFFSIYRLLLGILILVLFFIGK